MSTILQRNPYPMIPTKTLPLMRQHWALALFVWTLSLIIPTPPASANMVLSEAILHFEPGKPLRKDIEIENVGDETLYIQVEPMIVRNPGTENEERDAFKDPREAGLLVTPNKIVVPPKGRKLVRFVVLKQPVEQDAVYRVTFKPISNELVPDKNQIGVKIVIAYQVLVLVQPIKPQPNLVVKREGNQLKFKNKGNTNVLLREGKQCPTDTANDDECETLRGNRLYAGNEWAVNLPLDRPVEYYLSIGTKNSIEKY